MAPYSLLSIFICPILLLLPLLFLLKNKFPVKHNALNQVPPGPPGLPIIGNLHQLGELPHVSLSQLSKKYGPVMLLHLGGTPTVIITSAQAAKEVLKTHDLHTCNRPFSTTSKRLGYNFRNIGSAPYGNYYRQMRKIFVLEVLGTKRAQSFRSIRQEEVALLIDSISNFSSSSTPVDLSKTMLSLSANITCRVAFGKSFRERGNFQDIINEVSILLGSFFAADFFPYAGWIVDRFTRLHSRLEQIFNELDNFMKQVIDDHVYAKKLKQEQEFEDIVDVLLKQAKNGIKSPAFQITQDHIKVLLLETFLAGVDSSAITLVWAMAELVRNPRVMRRAQEEIRAFVGDAGKICDSKLDHFAYLKMVVKETLRLHPTAPLLIPRETTSTINLNGYHIPSKTRIQINAWAIARDSETWENPLEFIPERFMDSSIEWRGKNYEFLPFGAGRRMCPGMALGVATVEFALANLLYSFDWKLPDGMKVEDINMEEVFGIATYKKVPLLLVPVKHRPDLAKQLS